VNLHINNVFWTFQGEGYHAGRRALFVRMPYCNLKCPWCDTEFNSHKEWPEDEFVKFAKQEKCGFAVITGGEPMMHKHTQSVANILKALGFYIACETNGMFPIVNNIDFITVSPKAYSDSPFSIHPNAYLNANEFKYVVEKDFDFKALRFHNTGDGRRYSLSPEFNDMKNSLARIFEYIKENPGWRISLQTHKWMDVP